MLCLNLTKKTPCLNIFQKYLIYVLHLGGDQDVDGNGYPDLVVGSLSDKAVLFRSRPVVKVNSVITSTKNVLSFPGKYNYYLFINV